MAVAGALGAADAVGAGRSWDQAYTYTLPLPCCGLARYVTY